MTCAVSRDLVQDHVNLLRGYTTWWTQYCDLVMKNKICKEYWNLLKSL